MTRPVTDAERAIMIAHRFTARTVTTTVTMPWKEPISKIWKRQNDRSFRGKFARDWSEEPGIPDEVARQAERISISLCGLLKDDAI